MRRLLALLLLGVLLRANLLLAGEPPASPPKPEAASAVANNGLLRDSSGPCPPPPLNHCYPCPNCQTCQPGLLSTCVFNFCPCWTVEAGAVVLYRSSPHGAPIVGRTTPNVIEGVETDPGSGFGPRIEVGRNVRNVGRMQFIYYGFNDGASDYTSTTSYVDGPVEGLQTLAGQYWSDLHNTELNLKWCLAGEMNWLAGFRWIEIDERLEGLLLQDEMVVQGQPVSSDSWLLSRMYNHLYGFQMGFDGTVWRFSPNLSADGVLKAGIYGNHIASKLITDTLDGPLRRRETLGHTAFVGELGIGGTYQVAPHMKATGGYQLLWLEGVGTLPDALSADRSRWTAGSPFYHGVQFGLEYAW